MQVTVLQAHEPGAEAEVDFGQLYAQVAGVLLNLWMFVMRLSCSDRAFHAAFATQAREAFLEGHVLAFQYFGAVPGPGPGMPTSSSRRDVAGDRGRRARVCVRQNYYGTEPLLWNLRRAFPSARPAWAPLGRGAHFGLNHRPGRTVRDYERLPARHEAMACWAMTIIMTWRLARHNQSHQLHSTLSFRTGRCLQEAACDPGCRHRRITVVPSSLMLYGIRRLDGCNLSQVTAET